MWLYRNCNLTYLGHALLGRVVGFLLDNTSSLDGFRPVLFEYALVYPFMTRSRQRFTKHAAILGKALLVQINRLGCEHLAATSSNNRNLTELSYLSCID